MPQMHFNYINACMFVTFSQPGLSSCKRDSRQPQPPLSACMLTLVLLLEQYPNDF